MSKTKPHIDDATKAERHVDVSTLRTDHSVDPKALAGKVINAKTGNTRLHSLVRNPQNLHIVLNLIETQLELMYNTRDTSGMSVLFASLMAHNAKAYSVVYRISPELFSAVLDEKEQLEIEGRVSKIAPFRELIETN